jgi:hypothetical protein
MKKLEATVLLGVSLALTSSASPAHAAPKFLNGGECQMFSNQDRGFVDGSGMWNWSGHNAWTTCPLLRLTTTNTNGLSDLHVILNTGAGGAGAMCLAYSLSPTGSVLVQQTVPLETGSNREVDANFGPSLNVSSTTSSYGVSCLIADHAVIRQVRYNE